MSMGIGINTQNPDAGELNRKLEEIACFVWYTSEGRTIPKMFKYRDGEGVIQKVTKINVKKQEEKFYCGIPTQEFCCSTVMKDQKCPFRLYFYPESHLWKISWGE